MTCLKTLLHTACCSIPLLLTVPLPAEDRCASGPAGPHDLEYLTACRPQPVSIDERHAYLESLPPGGVRTTFTPAQRAKMDAIRTVLLFHGREGVYTTRVMDVPQATLALHGRAVLLVAAPVLDILSREELQAVVAHEIGHEYLSAGWQAARAAGDRRRLRQLEAACDAIAALTLVELGIPVARLTSAISHLEAYNRTRFGLPQNAADYPTATERRRLLVKFTASSPTGDRARRDRER